MRNKFAVRAEKVALVLGQGEKMEWETSKTTEKCVKNDEKWCINAGDEAVTRSRKKVCDADSVLRPASLERRLKQGATDARLRTESASVAPFLI